MSVTKKIDMLLGEATVPSQSNVLSTMSKGLKDVSDITSKVAMGLWHYFDLKIVGKKNPNLETSAKVFKSQPSKKLVDELWNRIGKSVEKSEQLTDDGLKQLKKNFYSFDKWLNKVYTFNSKNNTWEFTG